MVARRAACSAPAQSSPARLVRLRGEAGVLPQECSAGSAVEHAGACVGRGRGGIPECHPERERGIWAGRVERRVIGSRGGYVARGARSLAVLGMTIAALGMTIATHA